MQSGCYIVGGAVRDILLGLPGNDIDYVWVGKTSVDMFAKGFKQVGAGFPVFLDNMGNQHALARTEKKVGVGYNGFECTTDQVSLYDDLSRRDLTINALAVKVEDFDLFKQTADPKLVIDFFGGMEDLNNHTLVHINRNFSLDPVRILRTARFASRYGFNVKQSTINLMKIINDELNSVPTERIWTEIQKGLMEKYPQIMFNVLTQSNTLDVEIMKPFRNFSTNGLSGTSSTTSLSVKFTLVGLGFCDDDYDNLTIPNDCKKLSKMYNQYVGLLSTYDNSNPIQKLNMFMKIGLFNNDDLLNELLEVFSLHCPSEYNAMLEFINQDVLNLTGVNVQAIVAQCSTGQEIKNKLYDARIEALSHKF